MPLSHIGHALSRLALERAHVPVSISNGNVKTGAELLERIQCLSVGLRVNLGLQCGDRVAIAALNSDLYLEWLIAVPCAGGIIAPLNYRWSGQEACEAVLQIEPTFLVIDHHCAELGAQIQHRFPSVQIISLGCSINGALQADSVPHDSQDFRLLWAPDNLALICFTSGTTGKPKGAAISHNAIVVQSLAKIAMVNYSPSDIYLHTSPLCHIGGISSAHAILLVGGCHVFLPKFHSLDALSAIKKYQVTAMIAVPTMLKDLTSQLLPRGFEDTRMESVQTILNGAGSLSLALLQRTARSFPAARILSAYGMTEACSSMSFITLRDPASCKDEQTLAFNYANRELHLGGFCVGRPAPHVEVIVSTNADANRVRGCLHEEGDVFVRGPNMMEKYWGEMGHAFDGCGWFRTGDVGWMDRMGQVWLLGRRKDVIKSGGESVHCYEVEEILSRHPAIAAVVVAGVPDVRLGEVVGAMVLLRDGWKWKEDVVHVDRSDEQITHSSGPDTCFTQIVNEKVASPNSMQLFCGQQGLSRYKIPKIWCEKSGAFAVTSTGKVRKDVVRKELAVHIEGFSVGGGHQPMMEPILSKL
ncbi:hypothetical protein GOP47_0015428 [Adiantum capillus-veneris]|uniref:4-coumarate--CoA ligase n=1 Tax=Adiantum capillus-veneris TaxID=13818 RepID=A0A9D4ZCM7_ADICA|nr:hypothetical protein GOP47_0015428 [Adiantum capillus-veneris]